MNRAPGTIWCLRRDLTGPYVRTAELDKIALAFDDCVVYLSRADARLLAKRINQCLDATVKR